MVKLQPLELGIWVSITSIRRPALEGRHHEKLPFSLPIWVSNCEIRQPRQIFVGCLDHKTCASTSHSDLVLLPMSHAGLLEYKIK